jgi:hypothetical protein
MLNLMCAVKKGAMGGSQIKNKAWTVTPAETQCYKMMSLHKGLLLCANQKTGAIARQLPIIGNRGEVFSEGVCNTTVEQLFGEVFSAGSCDITIGLLGEMFSMWSMLRC